MNDLAQMFRRPIELVAEAPFRLGDTVVTPAALELRRDGEVGTVEPRVMQVLVALYRARGQAVSREELSDLCWKGRIVGDDSLNRSISQLRKALSNEPTVAVDTIPRVGYRLRTDMVEATARTVPAEQASRSLRPRRWMVFGAVAGLTIVVLGIAAAMWMSRPTPLTAGALRPLTREAGVENHPALSADGRRLAYSAGPGGGAPRDLFLRGVVLGDGAPERLTRTAEADEYAPAWNPGGDRLAFVRHQGEACALMLMSPPNGVERAIGDCHSPPAGLAWLGRDEVAFDDRRTGDAARRLYAMSVVSGEVRPLTTPPAGATGDAAPSVSPDGRHVAFRRTFALGSDDLFLLDLRTGRERRLTDSGRKATGFAWSGDDTLVFTTNRGGDFGLWALDVRNGAEPMRISPGVMPLGRLSSDLQGRRLAVEASRLRAPLHELTGDVSRPLVAADGVDWDPDVAPNGALVFGSDRSGANEIWTATPGATPVRLTSLDASYAYAPRWSPDGGQIVFIAVIDGQTDLYLVRADGSGLRRLTNDGGAKGRAAWTPDGERLIYSVRDGSGWRLMRLSPGSGDSVVIPGGEGVAVVERSGERLLARRADGPGLLALDPATGALSALATPIETDAVESWRPGAEGVFQVRRDAATSRALWLTTWDGTQRRLADLQPSPRSNFAVRDGAVIVTPQTTEDESDLMLIEIGKERP